MNLILAIELSSPEGFPSESISSSLDDSSMHRRESLDELNQKTEKDPSLPFLALVRRLGWIDAMKDRLPHLSIKN